MITNIQLKGFLNSLVSADNQITMDNEYSLPARAWITGQFSEDLAINLDNTGTHTYVPESNDCDKFSRFAWALAGLANAESQKGRGLAFGMFSYKRDLDGLGHCINFAVCRDPMGDLELVFLEPQTGLEVKLSKTEMLNCGTYLL